MKSLSGHLLVASSQLLDANFVKTVILLIQHTGEGALGLVLNRSTSKTVKELWKEVGQSPCESGQSVRLGGPVSGPLMSVHTSRSLAEVEILPGIFFAAKKANLDELVRQHEHAYMVFVGHAGWGPGQLESEIAAGAWATTPATAEYIFYEGENLNLWEEVSRHIQASTLPSMLNIKHVPDDPSVN
jgi:putative transcriptional regulator